MLKLQYILMIAAYCTISH